METSARESTIVNTSDTPGKRLNLTRKINILSEIILRVQNKNHLHNNGNIRYYYIEGSNHYTLTDLVRTSPFFCALLGGSYKKSGYDTLKFINQKSLAFFDDYLK
jgi:hypothetical protein